MPAPATTVYQASFKTPTGTLLNIYANDGGEFEELLDAYEQFIPKIAAIESALGSASTVAQRVPLAPPAQQPAPTPAQAPAPAGWGGNEAPAQGEGQATHLCDHGEPMKYIAPGISKATGKPYKGFYACARPRQDQCAKKVWL